MKILTLIRNKINKKIQKKHLMKKFKLFTLNFII